MRGGVAAGALAALAVALLVVTPLPLHPASAQVPDLGPQGIHVAYGAEAASEVSIAWSGPATRETPLVEYGTTDEYGATWLATGTPVPGDQPVAYVARLSHLEPATAYHYRIVMEGAASGDLTFRTAPLPGNAAQVRVAAWADHGVPDARNPAAEADGDAPLRNRDLALSLAPDLHIVAGDISYANGFPGTWDAYFAALEPYAASTPYMVAPGNHEREPGLGFRQYDARFAMPSAEGERWYALRVGPVLLLGMDSERACAASPQSEVVPLADAPCDGGPDPAQLAFLRSTLESAARDPTVRWTVAYHHYPVWSDGPHGPYAGVVENWEPVYEAAGVDLVVTGHDHLYERSKPIRNGTVAEAGTTYVVAGTGGASHYAFQSAQPPEWEAARNAEDYGVLLLTFTNDTVTGEFHALGGGVKDNFTLVQDAGGFSRLATAADLAPPASAPPDGEQRSGAPSTSAVALVFLAAAITLRRGWRRGRGAAKP